MGCVSCVCVCVCYLLRVHLEAEDVLVGAADLGVLHQGVLDLPGHRHGLAQQRGVVPEVRLEGDEGGREGEEELWESDG